MKGRRAARWQKKVSRLPAAEMIKALVDNGFTGLYLDKFGYLDDGKELMEAISKVVQAPPIFDHHGRSFWDLR